MARRKFNREFKISAVQLVNHQGLVLLKRKGFFRTLGETSL